MESDLRAEGFSGELLIGTSGGGCQHVTEVVGRPVTMLKSGPAMAPVAGKAYTTIEDLGRDAIVCDTGGTTFDVGLVRDGELVYTRDSWLGRRWLGHMVAMSTVDVRSIGAGGGSIAWVDAGGLLRVGPQSAGAVPGPACYGAGGDQPTVTDACVVLGWFDPDYFNGGRMKLDAAAAHRVVEKLAQKLGRSVSDTAFAIITIANELMIKAIHEITVSEGVNPRESVIVAGGGAAGFNILPIARELGCSTTILPKTASAMSACGMQYSDIVFEQTRSRVTMSGSFDLDGVNTALAEIDAALEHFRNNLHGAERAAVRKEYLVEARYKSQVWELDTPLPVSVSERTRTWRRWSRHSTPSTIGFMPCATSKAKSNASTGAAGFRSGCRSRRSRCARRFRGASRSPGPAAPLISVRTICARRRCSAAASLSPARQLPVRRSSRSRRRRSSSIRR